MIPNVLSIAGSDPSGGAGIQADIKTFAALGCYGMAVITALTAQNTCGVRDIHLPPPAFVAAEIDVIFEDIRVDAVKIGMLGSGSIAEAVVARLAIHNPPFIVFDPVLAATSGDSLASGELGAVIIDKLFPLATLVTPNLAEAAQLTGLSPATEDADALAQALRARGARAALVKGGHGTGATSDDLLLAGDARQIFSAPRIPTANTHGTGCALSAAIAAYLARGLALAEAIDQAKAYVTKALAAADDLSVGKGPGPLRHGFET